MGSLCHLWFVTNQPRDNLYLWSIPQHTVLVDREFPQHPLEYYFKLGLPDGGDQTIQVKNIVRICCNQLNLDKTYDPSIDILRAKLSIRLTENQVIKYQLSFNILQDNTLNEDLVFTRPFKTEVFMNGQYMDKLIESSSIKHSYYLPGPLIHVTRVVEMKTLQEVDYNPDLHLLKLLQGDKSVRPTSSEVHQSQAYRAGLCLTLKHCLDL